MRNFILDSHGAIIEAESSESDPYTSFLAAHRQGDHHHKTLSVPTPATAEVYETPTREDVSIHSPTHSKRSHPLAAKNARRRIAFTPVRRKIVQGASILALIAIAFLSGLHFQNPSATSQTPMPATAEHALAMIVQKQLPTSHPKIQARIAHRTIVAQHHPTPKLQATRRIAQRQSPSVQDVRRPSQPRYVHMITASSAHPIPNSTPHALATLPTKPIFGLLSVRPARLIIGHGATLCVAVKHAQHLVATGLHAVMPNTINCQWITPRRTTTYTFVARSPNGASVHKSLTVRVFAQIQPAVIRSPRAPIAIKKKTRRIHQRHHRSPNPPSALALSSDQLRDF